MMPLNNREYLQLAILILAVPVQYFVVRQMGSTEDTRAFALSKMVNQIQQIQLNWLRVEPWHKWCSTLWSRFQESKGNLLHFLKNTKSETDDDDENGESPAIEVFNYRNKDGYFSQSTVPRNPRSPDVTFRVGQVIKHKLWGYHGVIVGWDEKARAPEDWIQTMHGKNAHWRQQPNYSILVDTRDRTVPQMTYVPQENIEVVKHTTVLHPRLEDFFEKFDGSQYLLRPWLKNIYPRD